MTPRDRLLSLLVERSLRLGDFTLASGARSNYYIDARRTTMSAEGQALVGRLGLAAISGLAPEARHVGGLTLGADPVSYAIAHASWREGGIPIDAFTVRKAPKSHGTSQRIEGGLPPDARVVVIEDSMTTGTSALSAVDVLRLAGAEVLAVFAVVDREEGAEDALRSAGIPVVHSLYRASELLAAARSL